MLAAAGTSPDWQPTGQKADSATSATTTPCTPAGPARSAARIGSCRACAPPTASRSARPALSSPSTSTASAATSKQRAIADGSAPAALSATTSTGCSAARRAIPHCSAWSMLSAPRTGPSRSSSGSAQPRSRSCFAASATAPSLRRTTALTPYPASPPSTSGRSCSTTVYSPIATRTCRASSDGSKASSTGSPMRYASRSSTSPRGTTCGASGPKPGLAQPLAGQSTPRSRRSPKR